MHKEQTVSELAQFIHNSPLCSTHEHTELEGFYANAPHDVLSNLFDNYVLHDIVSAGADQGDAKALVDASDPDIAKRFGRIEPFWEEAQYTGYGRSVQHTARELYGVDEISLQALAAAQEREANRGHVGERLRILKAVANLDHVQVDHAARFIPAEAFGQDFFLYDINVCRFCDGTPEIENLLAEAGIEIKTLDDLEAAIERTIGANSDIAVAVKSQHAYHRTLRWEERNRDDAELALASWMANGHSTPVSDRICLGDWCMARIAELAGEHDLPFKLHTGFHADCDNLNVDVIKPGQLCSLIRRFPETRFLLMHIGYPYFGEITAMAKSFRNVAIDMCWAWSIDPRSSAEFLRRFLHAVPANKLFAFGGDAAVPAASVGYARQAREGLAYALQKEIDDGYFDERQALKLAEKLMMANQMTYFDLDRKKEISRAATGARFSGAPGLEAASSDKTSFWDRGAILHAAWENFGPSNGGDRPR